ncbi:NERD domain-containing protein [Streptomyces osmaniensis]|uniref:NERD domain-containing protein n=1 Tax=Streptomyces osmaniensis TaxID=593134 RepID=A0ABP6YV37_9ACTN|nr:NERD domain-containing protein [Streptomyces sp. JCM17656]
MTAGQSPLEWAARERRAARKGVRRRVLAWVGLNPAARRADALTARAAHGAAGERKTAELLARLSEGWRIAYGRKLPPYANDYDALVIPPAGDVVLALDTKMWRRNWVTSLHEGRVYCGPDDRQGQVEGVARAAARLERALAVPGLRVWPLLVVHGSPVMQPGLPEGRLEARAVEWDGVVHVLGPDWLVPTLVASARGGVDEERAAWLAERVNAVVPPCPGGA